MQRFYKKIKTQFSSIRFLSRMFGSRQRASLVLVTNQWELCQQEIERKLCRYLREKGYYATPDYNVDHVSIHVALVPYRIAMVRKQEPAQERKIARHLQRRGWAVYFYSEDHIRKEIERLLYTIETNIHPLENASLHP